MKIGHYRALRPAVFLDRDGTLIEDRGHLSVPEQVVFFRDTVPALLELQKEFLLFIVTHQSGIAKGLVTADEVEAVNRHVVAYLAEAGIVITHVYCCPHDRSERCHCIKPNPYHLHQAATNFGVDLARSVVMGDHPHDIELGRGAGATGIYLLTGHGEKHLGGLPCGAIVTKGIGHASRLAIQMLVSGLREEPSRLSTEENA